MPVILPTPVYNSITGDLYELPAETIKAIYGFPVPAGFQGEGTRESLVYVLDSPACTSKRSTRRQRLADNPKGTLPFEQHIKTKNMKKILKLKEPNVIQSNHIPQRVPPANTIFAVYMYRQFMSSLCT